MSWYNPTTWFGGTDDRNYAPGARYEAGVGTTTTNPEIERAKAARVAAGLAPLPPRYQNGAQVGPGRETPAGTGVDSRGKPIYAAATISDQTGEAIPWQVNDSTRQALLAQQGAKAGIFANQSQDRYGQYSQQGADALAMLQARANGANSVSAMQLQQGLQQNLAAQRANAASAAPQNQAMSARTAAIQSGRLGAGLSGQQALAGMQESNQAQQQYGALLQGLRGQDLDAINGARQTAANAYGAQASGAPQKTWWEKNGPAVQAGAGFIAAAASDRRLKKEVRDGTKDAEASLRGLSAHSFKYKDEKFGEGRRVGIMAQDLERAGLGHAVVNTTFGKAIHGGHLSASLAAMMPGLDARLRKLEGKG